MCSLTDCQEWPPSLPISGCFFRWMIICSCFKCYLTLANAASCRFSHFNVFKNKGFKVAETDMRYFARSKFFGSLVQKKTFGLI